MTKANEAGLQQMDWGDDTGQQSGAATDGLGWWHWPQAGGCNGWAGTMTLAPSACSGCWLCPLLAKTVTLAKRPVLAAGCAPWGPCGREQRMCL